MEAAEAVEAEAAVAAEVVVVEAEAAVEAVAVEVAAVAGTVSVVAVDAELVETVDEVAAGGVESPRRREQGEGDTRHGEDQQREQDAEQSEDPAPPRAALHDLRDCGRRCR